MNDVDEFIKRKILLILAEESTNKPVLNFDHRLIGFQLYSLFFSDSLCRTAHKKFLSAFYLKNHALIL